LIVTIDELMQLDLDELSRLEPDQAWSLGSRVAAACLIEAAAPKAGNVHPNASYADMTYDDFRRSAEAIAHVFENSQSLSIGELILRSIQATRAVISVNTNLGIVLLLAPLSRAKPIDQTLAALDAEDAKNIYSAICLAGAGGLGDVSDMDVRRQAPPSILKAMHEAAERDDIAREYVNNFSGVFAMSRRLRELRKSYGGDWFQAVCRLQLERLAEFGDTLIARKNGSGIQEEVRRRAKDVLGLQLETNSQSQGCLPLPVLTGEGSGVRGYEIGSEAYLEFDRRLRSDGHRLNPGTTADLIAAAIFIEMS
jgi:triphosphoribosyl-dephospho-CoA synthase